MAIDRIRNRPAPKDVQAPATPVATPPVRPERAAGVAETRAVPDARDVAKLMGNVAGAPATRSVAPPAGASASVAVAFDKIPTVGGGPAQARILSDGMEAWNARWEMLAGAKSSIDTTYFILEKDVFGFSFLGALLKKQLEGVPVRLMTDSMADTTGKRGFTASFRGKDYLQELSNHGAQAFIYHPIWQRPMDALKGDYSLLASNHDKVLCVDHQRGITGGRNIAIDYFADPADRPDAWRDMDVALEGKGPAAGLTEAMDAELSQENVARKVDPDLFGNWVKRDIELLGSYAIMDTWLQDPPFTDAEKAKLRADPAARQALAANLLDRAVQQLPALLPEKLRREPNERELEMLKAQASQLVDQLEARGSRHRYLANRLPERATEAKILDQTSAAGTRTNGFAPALVDLVEGAKKRIVIENPYVVLTEDMMAALERAAQRGVKISILTNSPLSTDSDVTQAFFLEDWPYILARCPTAEIFVATGTRKFHGKSAVIDDDEALVTTYNMDLLSGYVNGEVGAAVKSKELAQDLLKAFEQDKANPANGFLEYKIQKDASGKPVIKDGKPVPLFGPEDHLPAKVLEEYRSKRQRWGHTIRDNVGYFSPLRHPPLA